MNRPDAPPSSNLRSLLIDARQFVGKSGCSVGHSVSEVLDRAKPGDRHCLYCEQQSALHDRLMTAVSEVTVAAHETSAVPPRALIERLHGFVEKTSDPAGYNRALWAIEEALGSLPETEALHPSMHGLTRDEQRQLIEDLWESGEGCANCAVKFRKLRLAHPVGAVKAGEKP